MYSTAPAPAVSPVAVVGGGPAGLAAALALGKCGCETMLVAAPAAPGAPPDTRTAALFAGSIQFLRNLGVWNDLLPYSAPISVIRIVDDTGGMLKAPEATFTARDAGREVFGYNVPNQRLVDALWREISRTPAVRAAPGTRVESLLPGPTAVRLALDTGEAIPAQLIVAADGRQSRCREAAGIATKSWRYEQSALACTFSHSRPHHDVSTELHRPAGPLTTVPMSGRASSLVWVERPEEAARLAALDDAAFRAALEIRLQGLLGSIGELGPRRAFPLAGLTAEVLGKNRIALVGEAGHVIPPIGAQGLNLGFRDAAVIAELTLDALEKADDPGGAAILAAYSNLRSRDVTSRVWTVDLLNRSLLSGLPPVQLARGAGLAALKLLAPLRRALVKEGLEPSGVAPRLMREHGAASTAG